ncbi:MAG: GNAT family N-acetyltransferase [Fuerstiella sp.]
MTPLEPSILIRVATIDDVEILADYNCRLAHETEDRQLDRTTVLSGVKRGLNVGDEVQYYVAESGGNVIGQLMLTREWSDWRDGWIVWLQSVYVAAEFRGQGVFRRLLQYVRQQLHDQPDVLGLRLYVEEENSAAITTYNRLGFQHPGYRVMELPLP